MFNEYAETHRDVIEILMFYLPADGDEPLDPNDFDEKAIDGIVQELLVDESITALSVDDIITRYEEYVKLN